MNFSPNIGLHLTQKDESRNYKELRLELSGTAEDSNMMIIDSEIGNIKARRDKHIIYSASEPVNQRAIYGTRLFKEIGICQRVCLVALMEKQPQMLICFPFLNKTNLPLTLIVRCSFQIIRKLGIQTDAGTVVIINDSEIPIVSGIFELGFGQVDIYSLVFKSAVNVNIYYMY